MSSHINNYVLKKSCCYTALVVASGPAIVVRPMVITSSCLVGVMPSNIHGTHLRRCNCTTKSQNLKGVEMLAAQRTQPLVETQRREGPPGGDSPAPGHVCNAQCIVLELDSISIHW